MKIEIFSQKQTAFRHTADNDEDDDSFTTRRKSRSASFLQPRISIAHDDLRRLNFLAQKAIDNGNSSKTSETDSNSLSKPFLLKKKIEG